MTWNLGTTNQEHLDEHNLFDHAGIATPTAGKILGVSGGKYTQVDAGTGDHDALTGVSANDHHAENHQARHQSGGADPLSGSIDATARTAVKKNGATIGTRRAINFIEGSNITLTVADDVGSEEVDVTITGAAGGGGGSESVYWVNESNLSIPSGQSGVYVVRSFNGIRTITLPAISTLPSTGMVVTVKRHGTNYVDVDCNGADEIEPGAGIVSKRLFNNWAAIKLAANPTEGTYWFELGYYGAIT